MDNSINYNIFVNFLKENFKNFPKCKIEELKEFYKKTYKKYYNTIESNKQIKSLVEIATDGKNPKVLGRLMALLCARQTPYVYQLISKKLITEKYNDKELYKIIRTFYLKNKNNKKGGYCKTVQIRAENCYYEIMKIPNVEFDTYLDLGCGDCRFTEIFGRMLDLSFDKIHGRDAGTFDEITYSNKKHKIDYKKVHYVEPGHPLEFNDNSLSLVSCMLVLHHVKHLTYFLKEVHRVTKKGGIFMIMEHDAFNYADAMLCDIEHMMYMAVFIDKVNNNVIKDFYSKYRNWIEWSVIINKFGFKFIKKSFEFRSIDMEMQPTKHLMLYYQKL